MILRKLSAYKPIQSGRYIPYWRRLVDSLGRQLKLSQDRYMLSEQSATPSTEFIKIILDSFDYEHMPEDDFDKYHLVILPESTMVGKKFYPLVNSPRINRFTRKPIHEIILPANGIVDNINYSPDDTWDRWQDVKPFRLVSHNSMELNLPEDQLTFRFVHDKPSYMTFCIDIPALVIKFMKYVEHHGEEYPYVDRDTFIQKHVLTHIYNDAVDTWLMNFFASTLSDDDDIFEKLLEFSKVNQYVGISSLNLAYNDIQDLINRIRDDKIRLSAIFDTDLFMEDKLSDVMNLHDRTMVVGTDNRTIGFELLKSSRLLQVLVDIIELQPDKTTKIRRKFTLEYGMIRRSNWKSHIPNKELRSIAKNIESSLVVATM